METRRDKGPWREQQGNTHVRTYTHGHVYPHMHAYSCTHMLTHSRPGLGSWKGRRERAARNSRRRQEHIWRCCLLFLGAAEAPVAGGGSSVPRPWAGSQALAPGAGRPSQSLSSIPLLVAAGWFGVCVRAFSSAHYPSSKLSQVLYSQRTHMQCVEAAGSVPAASGHTRGAPTPLCLVCCPPFPLDLSPSCFSNQGPVLEEGRGLKPLVTCRPPTAPASLAPSRPYARALPPG